MHARSKAEEITTQPHLWTDKGNLETLPTETARLQPAGHFFTSLCETLPVVLLQCCCGTTLPQTIEFLLSRAFYDLYAMTCECPWVESS